MARSCYNGSMLEPSAKAPTFTLSDQSSTNVTLSSYGKTYKVSPKDTPTNLLTALGIG